MSTTDTMSNADPKEPLARLVDLIEVARKGEDHYVGQSEDIGTPAVFGGQVLAQALMAACRTAPEGRAVHSLHAYFPLPGEHIPIDYQVGRVRDGGSFSTRPTAAKRPHGRMLEIGIPNIYTAYIIVKHRGLLP